jgi:ABC-type nitrate/sulfonate/bicarbonate transport system substrate-binding protein
VDLRKGEGPAEIASMNGGFVVWQARRSYVEKNAPTIDAFLKAQADAIAWLRDEKNFGEAMELAAKNFKLGDVPNREQAMQQIVRESISQYGTKLDRNVVTGFNNFLLTNKLIDKPLDASSIVYKNAP